MIGHIFSGRFKSICIQKEKYLVELSRYIHLNPVRSGMTAAPEEYPEALASLLTQGISPLQEGGGGIGVRYCYLQTDPAMGWMIELIEATPGMQAMNDELRAIASRWDGRTQLHTLA